MEEQNQFPEIRLFNTFSRSVEVFEPLQAGVVKMYCCGPTVYSLPHIGNFRCFLFADFLRRILEFAGYQVTHVMNLTDVGHLVSDADDGEDKMLLAAKREKKSSQEIADHYSNIFFNHCAKLNIKRPSIVCKATEHIKEMIDLIRRLEQRGIAYSSGGNVYFDVSRFPNYGNLARLNTEALKAGARVDLDDKKRSPLDFALWFTKSKFENHELQWDSPWGLGYPGWHIECSAMSMKYLGETFDIHCGGCDLIPVHHTNEIAQSEAATDKPLARFWLHNAFLVLEHEKMSKSKGTFLTLDTLCDQGFDPLSYRLLCLGASYRSELAYSSDAIQGAANSLQKIKNAVISWKEEVSPAEPSVSLNKERCSELLSAFKEALFNDLGTAKALSIFYETMADGNLLAAEKLRLALTFDQIFGLGMAEWLPEEENVPEEVLLLVSKRHRARERRDWKEADVLRDKIQDLGYSIEDSQSGSRAKKLRTK